MLVGIEVQKTSTGNRTSFVEESESGEDDQIEEEDEEENEEQEPVGGDERRATPAAEKHVVFKGTYPIDRPVASSRIVDRSSYLRRQQASLLTLKSPRTFAIDEPIREDKAAEVSQQWADCDPSKVAHFDSQHPSFISVPFSFSISFLSATSSQALWSRSRINIDFIFIRYCLPFRC